MSNFWFTLKGGYPFIGEVFIIDPGSTLTKISNVDKKVITSVSARQVAYEMQH